MLYESTYNQYFLEHSWGPWKKHMYISRDEKNGRFVYKYPKEYYEKYNTFKKDRLDKAIADTKRGAGPTKNIANANYDSSRSANQNAAYYNSYYNIGIDKVINRSVKAAVKAMNFGLDMKEKAEGYLNRFAKAVSNAWNGAKSPDRTRVQAGKQFVSNMWNYTKNTVTAKRISSSIQNLIKGAGEAISKGWNEAKDTANKAKQKVTTTVDELGRKVRNTVTDARLRARGAERV